MEHRHTPVPWKCKRALRDNAPDCFVVTDGEWGFSNIAVAYTEADGRLISAAPDMLKTLSDLVSYIDDEGTAPTAEVIREVCEETISKAVSRD